VTRWLVIVALPGGAVIVAALGLYWLWRRRLPPGDAAIATLIKSPVPKFTGHDEALQQRTRQRREAAAKIRVRASHVESGAAVSDALRMVKR